MKLLFEKNKIVLMLFTIILMLNCMSCRPQSTNAVQHRLQWWLEALNWDRQRTEVTGKGVKIAVIDTGIDSSHPDLQNRIIKEYRVSDLPVTTQNDFEHGTNVAGIIASFPHNDKGVLGVAPKANIISIDISDDAGKASVEALIEAVNYAIDQKVDIINISVGVKKNSNDLHDIIKKAYNQNIAIVAAAGNDVDDNILYPAAYGEVICVGALSKNGDILYNYTNDNIDIIYAPGENIVTTYSSDKSDEMYMSATGTSVAAPIISGILALLKQQNSKWNLKEIYDYLYQIQTIDIHKIITDLT